MFDLWQFLVEKQRRRQILKHTESSRVKRFDDDSIEETSVFNS